MKVIKDKGAQGAWGSFSDTADMRPPITRQPSKATELALQPCKPKPLKMSALRHIFPTARPPRVLLTLWALPTPAFATWQGCRKTSCTLTTERCRLQPVRPSRYAVASQALTGFQLRPLRLVLLPHGDGEGSRATKSCILPLTP